MAFVHAKQRVWRRYPFLITLITWSISLDLAFHVWRPRIRRERDVTCSRNNGFRSRAVVRMYKIGVKSVLRSADSDQRGAGQLDRISSVHRWFVDYVDFTNTMLYVKVKITRADGTNLADGRTDEEIVRPSVRSFQTPSKRRTDRRTHVRLLDGFWHLNASLYIACPMSLGESHDSYYLILFANTNTLQSVRTLAYERERDRSHPTTGRERLWWCLQHRHSTRSSASTRLQYLVCAIVYIAVD